MKLNKKKIVLLVSLALLLIGVGSTLAYLFDVTSPVINEFTPSEVTCDVVETVDNDVKTNVMIHNTGNTDAFIRAAIVVNWANGDGDVYGKAPVQRTDYVMELDLANGWIKGNDGFYYWTKPVAANDDASDNDLTGVLIKEVKLADGKEAPEGYALSVEILCSAVQNEPAAAVEAWSNGLYTVDANGDLKAKEVRQ